MKDEEQLRLLSIFHYVVAGITALFACIPLIHVAIGLMLILGAPFAGGHGEAPPVWFGYIFLLVGGSIVLVGWAMAIFAFFSGRFIAARKRRTFSLVVAGVLCTFVPFGTVLGVFTIIVLARDSVQRLYSGASLPPVH